MRTRRIQVKVFNKTGRRNANPEYILQSQVVDYIRLKYPYPICLITCSPVSLIMSLPSGMKAKLMGYTKGTPDLFIFKIFSIKALVIEFKIKPNTPTPEQEVWLDFLRSCGHMVGVCYTFEEAKKIIDCYFKGIE